MGIDGIKKLNTGLSEEEVPMTNLEDKKSYFDEEKGVKEHLKKAYLNYHLVQKIGDELKDSFMFLNKEQLLGVLNGLRKSNILSEEEANEIRFRLNNNNLPDDIRERDIVRIKDLFINGVSNPEFIKKFDIFKYIPKSKLLQILVLGLSLISSTGPFDSDSEVTKK